MTDLEECKTKGKFHCGYGNGSDGSRAGEVGGRSDGTDDRYEYVHSSGGLGGDKVASGSRDGEGGGEDAGGSGSGGLSDDAGDDGGSSGNSSNGNSIK